MVGKSFINKNIRKIINWYYNEQNNKFYIKGVENDTEGFINRVK